TSYSVILSVHSFPSIHFPLFFLLLSPISAIISSQAILILFTSCPNSFSSGYCWLEKNGPTTTFLQRRRTSQDDKVEIGMRRRRKVRLVVVSKKSMDI
ncbi:hypothetical protein KSS87_023829, partial [Heliosperma pusillum]